MVSKNREKKSVGTDGVPGEILKLVGEAMTPYLPRLLEVSVNNAIIPCGWKNHSGTIYNVGDR